MLTVRIYFVYINIVHATSQRHGYRRMVHGFKAGEEQEPFLSAHLKLFSLISFSLIFIHSVVPQVMS